MTDTTAPIPRGSLVLVEVHGLPDNDVKEFAYMTDREVGTGELVNVPAPDWSVRVTGRTTLPGFVLGVSSSPIPHDRIRTILPDHSHMPVPEALTAMLASWSEEARHHEGHAADLIVQAEGHREKALRLYERIGQVTRAAGLH